MKNYINIKLTFISIVILATSCKKFLDIGAPSTSINAENVYQLDNTAAATLTGIYAQMMYSDFAAGGITSISFLTELSADNLILFDLNKLDFLAYYRNDLNPEYSNQAKNLFSNFYTRIYTINAAVEGLNKASTLTPRIKQQLLGEAYFLRAFYYFYLVNYFKNIPLITSTDYKLNSTISTSPPSEIYNQIISDLQNAKKLLDEKYYDGTITKLISERIRPNKYAATSLLARVYLFNKEYKSAELAATEVINQNTLYSILPLDQVFLKNSQETIWALQPVKTGYNTDEASVFLLTTPPGSVGKSVYASNSLVSSFESGDGRLSHWMGEYASGTATFPYAAKYKIDANSNQVKEYNIVFRLAEQYLIRAEARAEQNNLSGAIEDLNVIRKRAELNSLGTLQQNNLRDTILHENRVEYFMEWGHRWLDLKRNDNIDKIMQEAEIFKGGIWVSYKSLFPIPNSEILRNKNLKQNPGYN
ncbi:RagB/SusD family nutrient uptake outer membrane protein [Chitinophaga sp. 22536]|uniref:RagB/SusD family nutrient uptake outer membrane protein n=1 Tax=unclassified Chitinophaga TaxID=2619133 RepID=UPI003F853E4B